MLVFYLESGIFQWCYYLITSVLKRSKLYYGKKGALNYRVIKTVCDRKAVAAINFVALGSQLFRYLGLSEPCCSLQLFLQTKLHWPRKWSWDTGTMHWAGIQNVGWASLLPFTCFLGKHVLASQVTLPCLCWCPKQSPFLPFPWHLRAGWQRDNLFPNTVYLWCQNSLWAGKTSYSPPVCQWHSCTIWMLNCHHPTAHPVKPQRKGRLATLGWTITVPGSGLLKELLERVQQRLQRWSGSGASLMRRAGPA